MGSIICVWCGYKDRVEFYNQTRSWSLEDDKLFYWECRDTHSCEERVAVQAGRHQ